MERIGDLLGPQRPAPFVEEAGGSLQEVEATAEHPGPVGAVGELRQEGQQAEEPGLVADVQVRGLAEPAQELRPSRLGQGEDLAAGGARPSSSCRSSSRAFSSLAIAG